MQRVDKVVRSKLRSTSSDLSAEFPEISRSVLYTIVRDLVCPLGPHAYLCAHQDNVKTYLSSMTDNIFEGGIEKLVLRYDKCVYTFKKNDTLRSHDEIFSDKI